MSFYPKPYGLGLPHLACSFIQQNLKEIQNWPRPCDLEFYIGH